MIVQLAFLRFLDIWLNITVLVDARRFWVDERVQHGYLGYFG